MSRILVVHAHPYPRRSRAGRRLLAEIKDLPDVEIRSLYDRYPDFTLDVVSEQAALRNADVLVWQSPFYWYGVPALLSLWFEKVLTPGFAYSEGGTELAGKRVMWVTTTGAPLPAYAATGMHRRPFEEYIPPIQETARFCGMRWLEPLVVHGAHSVDDKELARYAQTYRSRLEALCREESAHE